MLLLAAVGLTAMAYGQPSFRKPLQAPAKMKSPSVWPIHVGVKGCLAENNMVYSALHTAKTPLLLSVDGGMAVEWECSRSISVGMDVTYSSRGTRKAFRTEFLLNYSDSDFAYYDYSAKLRGIEVFLPVSVYKHAYLSENLTSQRNSSSKVYVFVGPELYVPLSGSMDWKRYYGDGTVYSEYHVDASKTTVRDFYYGLGIGIGFWHKAYLSTGNTRRPFNTFAISKVDFSCFLESNTLSTREMEGSVEHVYVWGDLGHEELGKRFGLVFKVSGTLLLPVRHKPSDSCYGIGDKSGTRRK